MTDNNIIIEQPSPPVESVRTICDCGKVVTTKTMKSHLKSQKCVYFMKTGEQKPRKVYVKVAELTEEEKNETRLALDKHKFAQLKNQYGW